MIDFLDHAAAVAAPGIRKVGVETLDLSADGRQQLLERRLVTDDIGIDQLAVVRKQQLDFCPQRPAQARSVEVALRQRIGKALAAFGFRRRSVQGCNNRSSGQ